MSALLPYFPAMYDDELFYSVLARAKRHLGMAMYGLYSEYVFGRPDVRSAYDLPTHLEALTSRLPGGAEMILTLAQQHSLLPYDVAFVDPATQSRVALAMRGRGMRPASLLAKTSLKNGSLSKLRFCEDCLRDWEEHNVEPYWRRAHQLPSALVCVKHGSILRASTVDVSQRGRQSWVCADRVSCPSDGASVCEVEDVQVLANLRFLAQDSWNVLIGSTQVECSPAWYRERLRSAGFVLTRGALDLQRTRRAIRDFWSSCLDLWPKMNDLDATHDTWVDDLLLDNQHKPPLNHLLFRRWIISLPAIDPPKPAFGEGPWICVNPLAEHCGQLVAATYERRPSNRGALCGRFTCECGFVYTLRKTADGRVSDPRPVKYGPLAVSMIREFSRQGRSVPDMARRLNVGADLIAQIAASNGIKLSRSPPSRWRGKSKVATCDPEGLSYELIAAQIDREYNRWTASLPGVIDPKRPFGEGPWLCVNPLADHRGTLIVANVERRRGDRGALVSKFSCQCGFVYTLRRLADGRVSRPRPAEYGPLAMAMIQAYSKDGRGVPHMSRQLRVHPSTILRIAASAGLKLRRRGGSRKL